MKSTIHAGVIGVAAGLLVLCPAMAQAPVPGKAYIEGVPFVGYHDVRGEKFPGSDVVNPSLTAAAKMMYGYWGEDFLRRARDKTEPAGWSGTTGEGATLEEVKALVARGIPVELAPATTPQAHRLYVVPATCAMFKDIKYTEPKAASGALGGMVVLEALDQLRAGGCGVGLNDSVYVAARLVIGYDDGRRVLVMHDASLGPDLELGYQEFEAMWRATGAKYWAGHPAVLPQTPPGRVASVRARSADDEAAVALFRAYGLEVAGRHAQSGPLLREALALEGLSPGRRHLLKLELGVALNETGRQAEAIEMLRAANAEFDGYSLAHDVLANLLDCCGGRDAKQEAKRERARAKALCSAEAQRRVADELGRDFHVMGCKGEMLGWYRP